MLQRFYRESPTTAPPERARRRVPWFQLAGLLLLIGVLYSGMLVELVKDWRTDPNYSHGFLVPLFSAFVIWRKRERLAAQTVRPCWFGFAAMTGALLMLFVGDLGAEFFLSRCSFLFLLAGLTLFFLGWGHLRQLLFPWTILFLMIPIPVIIFNQIAFPLQLLASRLAGTMLDWTGVPVLREGNLIHLPVMTLEVVEACSGIRSLLSLATLALIYGYFLEPRRRNRVLLIISAIPIAVAANALRILGTGLLGQYWNPNRALGFFHTFAGWILFVLSLSMLTGLHGLLRMAESRRTMRQT